jgi:hypothetical protein
VSLQGFFHEQRYPIWTANIAIVPASSIVGGMSYAFSGSWWYAIKVDLFVFTLLWLLVIPASWFADWLSAFVRMLLGIKDHAPEDRTPSRS